MMASNLIMKENVMTNTTKLISKLAVAIGLIGSLVFSAATPSLARSNDKAHEVAAAKHQQSAEPLYFQYATGNYGQKE